MAKKFTELKNIKTAEGNFGYSVNVFNGDRNLMGYRGLGGNSYPSTLLADLNTARKVACTLLPKESKKRYVIIYNSGTTAGKMVHINGEFLYNPTYQADWLEWKNVIYAINPNTGRVIKTYMNKDLYNFGR